jgi:Holliday junction resolvase RusA-like endonuclease
VSGSVLRVDVRGVPRPQPRPRFVGKGKGRHTVSTPENSPAARWKRLVLGAVLEAVDACDWQAIATGPVVLRLVIRFPTKDPARWWRPRTAVRNADFDNVAKLIADALTVRKVFGDDGQVAHAEQFHVWVPERHAGALVVVEAMEDRVLEWARATWGDDGAQTPDWLE